MLFLEHKTEDTPNIMLVKNQYKALNEGFTDELLKNTERKTPPGMFAQVIQTVELTAVWQKSLIRFIRLC